MPPRGPVLDAAGLCQRILRPDAGGKHDDIGFHGLAIGKTQHMLVLGAGFDAGGGLAGVHTHSQRLDMAAQHAAATLVHLHGHQSRRELDDMRLQTQVDQRLGRFEAQQSTADDRAAARIARGLANGHQILDGAVDEAILAVATGNGRHEGIGSGGQHQLVVAQARGRCW